MTEHRYHKSLICPECGVVDGLYEVTVVKTLTRVQAFETAEGKFVIEDFYTQEEREEDEYSRPEVRKETNYHCDNCNTDSEKLMTEAASAEKWRQEQAETIRIPAQRN